jgi:hypothetical protein
VHSLCVCFINFILCFGIISTQFLHVAPSRCEKCLLNKFARTEASIQCMRWRSWLRYCTTNRKVAGSIPDDAIGIFNSHNPSGRTLALGLTQLLTDVSTRNISWGLRRPIGRTDNLATLMCRLS